MSKGFIVLLLMLGSGGIAATPLDDYHFLMKRQGNSFPSIKKDSPSTPEFETKDQVRLIFYGALAFYQTFISSQNEPSCMFSPSCSEFTKQAFTKYGILGIVMGADRVLRCNGIGYEYYDPADLREGLILDPVEKYRF